MSKITLYEAVRNFLGPIAAEGCRVIAEGHESMPVTITFGPCEVNMTLADLKQLDEAYRLAFEAKERKRSAKYKGALL